MKKLFFSLSLLFAILASCKKDEHKVYFKGGTNPVLTSSVTSDTLPLSYSNKDNNALTLTWTNPNYNFTTGISSQDVNYEIEIDTAGSNFTSPKRQTISVNKDLSLSIAQSQFNDYLLNQLQLAPGTPHNLEIAITSFLKNSTGPLISNVLKYVVTPYSIPAKVSPPTSGELYITGNALASGWTNAPPTSQKFTQVSTTLYVITVGLIGGNSYTFLPTYASWNDKYSIAVKNDPNEVNGGDFQWQGNDILAPAASGNYMITVDFQRGKFTVVKQ
ncbi:MAG: SusE domain-containing protein [Bacteroidota bacterium]|nr:SusE domain-containing protein [Bacteroidota bacterium]